MREEVPDDIEMNSESPTIRGKVLVINSATFIEHFQVQGTLPGIAGDGQIGLRHSFCLKKAHRTEEK